MIRINLLDPDSRRRAARRADSTAARLANSGPSTLGGIMVAVALLLVGAHYLYLMREGPAISRQLAAAQAENQRMQGLQKQVDALQAHRKDLDNRIQAIEQLGDKTSGPSPLLATLGDAVNGGPNLWLTQLDQTGPSLQVAGVAANLDRIADFMTSLQQSGDFDDVKLDDSTEKTGPGQHSPFTFNLALHMGAAPVTVATATTAPAPAMPHAAAQH